MRSLGVNYASAQSEIGAGTAWTAPANALGAPNPDQASDDVAIMDLGANAASKVLLLQFPALTVPLTDGITGVRHVVNLCGDPDAAASTITLRLYAGTTPIGSAKTVAQNIGQGALTLVTLGDLTDLWGCVLSEALIAGSLRLGISVSNGALGFNSVQVGSVSQEVLYDPCTASWLRCHRGRERGKRMLPDARPFELGGFGGPDSAVFDVAAQTLALTCGRGFLPFTLPALPNSGSLAQLLGMTAWQLIGGDIFFNTVARASPGGRAPPALLLDTWQGSISVEDNYLYYSHASGARRIRRTDGAPLRNFAQFPCVMVNE